MRKLHCLELTATRAGVAEMAFAQGVSINKPVPVTVRTLFAQRPIITSDKR